MRHSIGLLALFMLLLPGAAALAADAPVVVVEGSASISVSALFSVVLFSLALIMLPKPLSKSALSDSLARGEDAAHFPTRTISGTRLPWFASTPNRAEGPFGAGSCHS